MGLQGQARSQSSGCAGCPGSHRPTHRKCHSPWALTGLFQTLTMGEAAMRLFCIKQEFTEFFFQYLLVVNRRNELVHFTNPASPCPAAQSPSSPHPGVLRLLEGTLAAPVLLCRAPGAQTPLPPPPLFLYHSLLEQGQRCLF